MSSSQPHRGAHFCVAMEQETFDPPMNTERQTATKRIFTTEAQRHGEKQSQNRRAQRWQRSQRRDPLGTSVSAPSVRENRRGLRRFWPLVVQNTDKKEARTRIPLRWVFIRVHPCSSVAKLVLLLWYSPNGVMRRTSLVLRKYRWGSTQASPRLPGSQRQG